MKYHNFLIYLFLLILTGCKIPDNMGNTSNPYNNSNSRDGSYTQNMMYSSQKDAAAKREAKRLADYEVQKEAEGIRAQRMAQYEAQKKEEQVRYEAHQRYLANRREDIKQAEANYQASHDALWASYTTDDMQRHLEHQRYSMDDDVKLLEKEQPFYDNDRVHAAVLNTYIKENNKIYNKLNNGESSPFRLDDHKDQLILTIKQMEIANDPAVNRNYFVICEKGPGFGVIFDVLGEAFTGGMMGKAVSAGGMAEELTHHYECKLRARVNKCIITYYYSKNKNRYFEREEEIIKDPFQIRPLTFSVFGLTKNLEYVTIEAIRNISGKEEAQFAVWKVNSADGELTPYNANDFKENVFPLYSNK